MNHYTSIEQSKKLVELGLNPDTADMVHIVKRNDCREPWESVAEDPGNIYTGLKDSIAMCLSDYALPCWSLGALLELMPIIDDNSYSLSGTLNKGALCKHPCTSVMFQEESPLEAVYNMICWLLERNYIKKGE